MKLLKCVAVACAGASLGVSVGTAHASSITVETTVQKVSSTGGCSLQEAIWAAELDASLARDPAHPADPSKFITTGCTPGDGADTIVLLPGGQIKAEFPMSSLVQDIHNYLGPTATPIIHTQITILGEGARLVRTGTRNFRAFAVGTGGDLSIADLHVKGFLARGGNGAGRGGGGLGAGGAIYALQASVTIDRSTFEANGAQGGSGGGGSAWGGGGGGGVGGNGGAPFDVAFVGGGGGGGSGGDGGRGDADNFAGGSGGGGGGTVQDGQSGDGDPDTGHPKLHGGIACGGQGGWSDVGFGGDNGFEAECRGGGGGGGEAYRPVVGFTGAGNGGDGGYGGGGGGGAYDNGDGGDGGFGGGGGGAPIFGLPDGFTGGSGGDGGFGGGGGAGPGGAIFGGPGEGGTFAGDPDISHGGGGAGLGGAIFGHEAAITITNSTFTGNDAFRGNSGGGDAQPGQDGGGAIFAVAGSLKVVHSTVAGNDHGGIGVYRPTTGEATSFELRNTIVAGNGVGRTCFSRNAVSATGSGNLIVDGDAAGFNPCPGIEQTDDPQLQTLQIIAPGWTPTMAIPLTSPAVDNADPAFAEQLDQRTALRPYGAGFDIGAYEAGNRPPVTAITLDPASPTGSNGWYTNPAVGVTVFASDPDGTVAETRCVLDPATAPARFDDLPSSCGVSSVVGDGRHSIYAGSSDNNGATESPLAHVAVDIDSVPPTLNPSLSDASPTLGQTGVTADPGSSDATSGIATASCGAISTSTAGDHTVTCTATDRAGHTRTAAVHYLVGYRIQGYFSPVSMSQWRLGTTVPVKIALANLAGTRISDSEAAALVTACRVRFSTSGAQTLTPQCMKYDPINNQFIYNWKLANTGTGPATIKMSIRYPGTTSVSEKTEPITITG